MSLNILVELPQYSLTLNVQARPDETVLDLKREISRACPGGPRVEGQRLISRGRILKDTEKIDSLWVLESEAHVVHLAVNSWASTPPDIPGPSISSTSTPNLTIPGAQPHVQPSPQSFPQPPPTMNIHAPSVSHQVSFSGPVPYVRLLHSKSLRALSRSAPSVPESPSEMSSHKSFAHSLFRELGLNWPAIFDAEFPPPAEGGVTYEHTLIGGKPFLQNLTPHETPTARQQHALNVLGYTFPLLDLSLEQIQWAPPPTATVNANAIMQVAMNNQRAANIEVRIPVRALLTPLIFLCLRTLLLLYLFSPARKPVFGVMLAAWVLYEAWGAVRGAFGGDNARGEANGNGNAPARGPAQPQQPANNNNANRAAMPPAFMPHQNPARFRAMASTNADAVLGRMSRLNLERESRALNGEPDASAEPGILTKIQMFFSLLVLTLHPAFWNRRRTVLRSREGRIRTEANAREAAAQNEEPGDGDERARQARQQLLADHARRPAWVREYVERVRSGDWVDD